MLYDIVWFKSFKSNNLRREALSVILIIFILLLSSFPKFLTFFFWPPSFKQNSALRHGARRLLPWDGLNQQQRLSTPNSLLSTALFWDSYAHNSSQNLLTLRMNLSFSLSLCKSSITLDPPSKRKWIILFKTVIIFKNVRLASEP